jgi:hypothetical protein
VTCSVTASSTGCPVHAVRDQRVPHVSTTSLDVPGSSPFGLAAVGDTAFVVLGSSIGVLATNTMPPRLVPTVPLPPINGAGVVLTHVGTALRRQQADLGTIPTGGFPREFAITGTTLLVSDYTSGQIQAIDTTTLP